mgnify:CR=1 FL=1
MYFMNFPFIFLIAAGVQSLPMVEVKPDLATDLENLGIEDLDELRDVVEFVNIFPSFGNAQFGSYFR